MIEKVSSGYFARQSWAKAPQVLATRKVAAQAIKDLREVMDTLHKG
jgi:hypothetical protein